MHQIRNLHNAANSLPISHAASTAQGVAIRERFAAAGARWLGHANEREMERSFALQVDALVAARAQVSSERDRAQAEWGRLILEQSTWTAHNRIEALATERLKMYIPDPAAVRMVQP